MIELKILKMIELLSEVGVITITKMKLDGNEYMVKFYDIYFAYEKTLLYALQRLLEHLLIQDLYLTSEQKELAKELLCN